MINIIMSIIGYLLSVFVGGIVFFALEIINKKTYMDGYNDGLKMAIKILEKEMIKNG